MVIAEFNEPLLDEMLPKFFKALSDSTRLKILLLLIDKERNVSELKNELGISQSGISNHLACLKWCGFVSTRREGKNIYYSVIDSRIKDVVMQAREVISDNAESIYSCTRIN